MTAGHELLYDLVGGRAQILLGIEDLLPGRDIVCCAGEQIDRANDVFKMQLPAEPDEFPLGQTVFLEQLDNGLEIPAPRQVDRILVPALESLLLLEIGGGIDGFA